MLSLQDPLLIFSDLDGSLLDIHTYEWQPAQPWLDKLQNYQVPVILCSSKTAAEMLDIQQDLGMEGLPFIAENGAVIQPDVRWESVKRHLNGMKHNEIYPLLAQLREQTGFKFTTFDDVDERVIAEWTGLNRHRSLLARQHEASVTLIWRDSDENMVRFEEALAGHGLQCLQGARFWHVLDARCGKDVAIGWLVEQYRAREGAVPTTLGLGDGPNDAPLLDSVDFAVAIKGINRHGITLKDDNPARVYHTQHSGPAGWREGLNHFFS
ncbi:mannosyl-3-phosphoglycerate phosphatase-related protein [Enterobacter wuhouensis]|uniref:Mannosyl-3-phosphoglycerate phosphatase-related protein n=1 Tax=Enterobacter wuhouensis TaxID=2529381 RepID=A0A4R0GEC0_9ENTR|nr:mannosyl-3-phosphoglycerate phosphatase-related protein [Enterobacter wuhouensis]TCB94522.1 mannosyl-3-phosphoglycerate phosphatase-related protein [Enterobacter wuhouensis]